jgi:hypothetical protein
VRFQLNHTSCLNRNFKEFKELAKC